MTTNSKPKLLSLNNYNYRRGGSDAVYIDHNNMFVEKGWDTAVFSMKHPKNRSSPWEEFFVDEIEFGHTYPVHQKLIMAGKVIYSFEARQQLAKLLNKFQPDVAHAHCINHHLSPSVLGLLKESGVPTVMTSHDLKIACPAYKMLNKNGICEKCKTGNLFHLIKNRCVHNSLSISSLIAVESAIHKSFGLYSNNLDKVVTPSIFFRQKLIEWGWAKDKLVYIPNFIDCSKVETRYDPGNYYCYFGRLAPEKGVETLIKAAIKTKINLKIAGLGPDEQYLKEISAGHENIKFLGFVSGRKLWDLISNSKAIVLPSEWYENAPISVLEAYAAGKPVIGANIGGIPEMLENAQTGFVFKSGSVDDLCEKINKLDTLSNNQIKMIGKNSRNYVSTTYTANRYFSEMLDLYCSLGVDSKCGI